MFFSTSIQITQHLFQKNMALRNLDTVVNIVKLGSAVALVAGMILLAFGICSILFQLRHEHNGTLFGTKIKRIIKGALLIAYSVWASKICNTVSTADIYYHRLWILVLALFIGVFLMVSIPALIEKIQDNKGRNHKA